jgi:DNA polymerase III delta subunit
MTTSPLAWFWGDDELSAARAVDRLARALDTEAGSPLERWELRGSLDKASTQVAELNERVATAVMFGGGTLAIVTGVGALAKTTERRDELIRTIGVVAPGNALVFLEAAKSGAKGPTQKKIVDVIKAAGGEIRAFTTPKAGSLTGWIENEARDQGLTLGPGAAREIAQRLGAFVTQGDVERRNQTWMASQELAKLALYREDGQVSVEDVRALVSEAIPASVWAFSDAVGERQRDKALGLLDRLLDGTPEPVLTTVLHRRIRELLEIGDRVASGERLPAAAKAMGINSEFRAQTLAGQARGWTVSELHAALDGILELDAMVKGALDTGQDAAQRRLAFTLWVVDHVGRAPVAVMAGSSRGGASVSG